MSSDATQSDMDKRIDKIDGILLEHKRDAKDKERNKNNSDTDADKGN
jgi:hypothetical protein